MNLVKLHEQSKKNLEEEIQNYKDEAQKQRKIIFQLEKERDRYINEASDLTQKVGESFLKDTLNSVIVGVDFISFISMVFRTKGF